MAWTSTYGAQYASLNLKFQDRYGKTWGEDIYLDVTGLTNAQIDTSVGAILDKFDALTSAQITSAKLILYTPVTYAPGAGVKTAPAIAAGDRLGDAAVLALVRQNPLVPSRVFRADVIIPAATVAASAGASGAIDYNDSSVQVADANVSGLVADLTTAGSTGTGVPALFMARLSGNGQLYNGFALSASKSKAVTLPIGDNQS